MITGTGLGLDSSALRKLATLRRLAWMLDGAARLPGTKFRFGLNSVIGLVPGGGDAVLTGLSLWIVWQARSLGVPGHVILRMLGNVGIEAAGGAVPILGDLFDMSFKANLRNLDMIERYLRRVDPQMDVRRQTRHGDQRR